MTWPEGECQAVRLCTVSGRPEGDCTRHHDGLGCTTGLYKLDGGIVSPLDAATYQVVNNSAPIRVDIDGGAYTGELVRHVLHEAVRVGAVRLTERP